MNEFIQKYETILKVLGLLINIVLFIASMIQVFNPLIVNINIVFMQDIDILFFLSDIIKHIFYFLLM